MKRNNKRENIEGEDFRLKGEYPAIEAGHSEERYNDPDGSRNDTGAFPIEDVAAYGWWKSLFPPKIE